MGQLNSWVWAPIAAVVSVSSVVPAIAQPATTTITGIQVRSVTTDANLPTIDITLETTTGAIAKPTEEADGLVLSLTIPNAKLQLASGDTFQQRENLPTGIQEVNVTQQGDRVVVRIIGTQGVPDVVLTPTDRGLSIAASVEIDPDDSEEEITVVGDQPSRYRSPNSTTGTRTDTPIINVPQAIQVVPEQVIEDRGVTSIGETLRNVSGVVPGRIAPDTQAFSPVIRGFQSENVLRNGLRDDSLRFANDISNVERVEVLKGPASVLFGQGDLSGTVNVVTKQPLDRPRYRVEYRVGSFNQHRPSIDFSAPLTADKVLSYRLNAAYQHSDSFRPFEQSDSYFFAPIIRLANKTTNLIAEFEYQKSSGSGTAPELPASGTVVRNPEGKIDFDENLGEPSLVETRSRAIRFGYALNHEFSPNWSIKHESVISNFDTKDNIGVTNIRLNLDNRSLTRLLTLNPGNQTNFTTNTAITGRFNTGDSIRHQLLIGAEYGRTRLRDTINFRTLANIDVFNPVYSPDLASAFVIPFQDTRTDENSVGIYLQDQIEIGRNVILVLGGRWDFATQRYRDFRADIESYERTDSEFSPRVGLVIKPFQDLALYASYSRSFTPVIGRTRLLDITTGQAVIGDPFKPERGTQVEVGLKANLFRNRASLTLAFYRLERENVTTTSGVNETISQIQVGKQRSQGIELDFAGEILPGWNVIASYAFTDAEITEDNRFEVGNQIPNVPRDAFSLWTTYEIQAGSLKGLGVGVGLFGQGERPGDLENSFTLPSFWRTDATVFYRRDRLRIALNIQNVFNERYFEGARNNVRVIPGAPLTVFGTISWDF